MNFYTSSHSIGRGTSLWNVKIEKMLFVNFQFWWYIYHIHYTILKCVLEFPDCVNSQVETRADTDKLVHISPVCGNFSMSTVIINLSDHQYRSYYDGWPPAPESQYEHVKTKRPRDTWRHNIHVTLYTWRLYIPPASRLISSQLFCSLFPDII